MTRRKNRDTPKCMDIKSWRAFTNKEMQAWLESKRSSLDNKNNKRKKSKKGSLLAVRKNLSPVDMYCYLKARFGEPNGFQNFLRRDDSDNLIHWDFNLKADNEDVYICGTSREIHFFLSENLADKDWHNFILNIKEDYKRVGKEKKAVLQSLEKWVIFPNKFVEIANICAEHHADIVDNIAGFKSFKTPSYKTKKESLAWQKTLKQLGERSAKLYKSCLELSLITPVLAEAFINMTILMLCKKEIRNDKRQFDSFIRSNIDIKIFDLFYKCESFAKVIDKDSPEFKNFKRIMDKRNHIIHGNIDPEREKIEIVYFEGKRPLFDDPGDHIGKVFDSLENRHQPQEVIKDYEAVHEFLYYVASCLEPKMKKGFWRIMEDGYPGYDVNRKKFGALFPEHTVMGILEGIRYDDELIVN